MKEVDLQAVRLAMFAHPGIKAIDDDLRLFRTEDGSLGVMATIQVTSPDVDPGPVARTVQIVLRERFEIDEVRLSFAGIEQRSSGSFESRGPLEKK